MSGISFPRTPKLELSPAQGSSTLANTEMGDIRCRPSPVCCKYSLTGHRNLLDNTATQLISANLDQINCRKCKLSFSILFPRPKKVCSSRQATICTRKCSPHRCRRAPVDPKSPGHTPHRPSHLIAEPKNSWGKT